MTDLTPAELDVEPQPDLPLLRKIIDHVTAHPEEWRQSSWYTPEGERTRFGLGQPGCGTAYCIAGHAVAMTEGVQLQGECDCGCGGQIELPASGRHWDEAATDALGLTNREASALFWGDNDLDDIERIAERIAARAGEVL